MRTDLLIAALCGMVVTAASIDAGEEYSGPKQVFAVKVTKLFKFDPPKGHTDPQEVTYHGVEMLTDKVLVAANEGRSHVDAVDTTTGKLLDRLADVSKPCCVERVPGQPGPSVKFLVSNLGDGTLQLAELTADNNLKSLGKVPVGKAPKRVAFLP